MVGGAGTSTTGGLGSRALGAMQNIGRALMLPIAVLPAAALLLRLGQDDLLGLPWMAGAGSAVFDNLAILFALGIAVGLTGGAGAAGLAAVVGFLVFEAVFNTFGSELAEEGTEPIVSMGVLAGIVMGLTTAGLYRRYSDIRLPDYLAFFGGKRFVPIVTALAALVLGAAFGFVWPVVGGWIDSLGQGLVGLGAVGTGLYGFFNRLLIPLGLHHVINTYIWFQLGSFEGASGEINRYFAGDPEAGSFLAGFFPVMMFGLPAACLAMIRHAHQRRVAIGILGSAAFASFLTGITEPIEFAFLFVAPLLFVVHAVLTATSMAITTLLDIQMGFGFSAGAIDYVLNFSKANTDQPLLLLLIGLGYGVVYYLVFSFFIKRFDLATPGRGEASTGMGADWILPESQRGPRETEQTTEREGAAVASPGGERDQDDVLAENTLAALGGRENVETVEGCITRLRLTVSDPEAVDETRLKGLGASGVIKRGRVVQVVLGTQSDRIAERMNKSLKEKA